MKTVANYELIGNRIRQKRKSMNLTQEALGKLTGISTAHVGHIERGTRKLSVETLLKLTKALNESTDYILLNKR